MKFTKEHKHNLSKALRGRDITWADKIAEGMVGNQNAKGQDFNERSHGIHGGFAYAAEAERNPDLTWTLHITFFTPFKGQREINTDFPGARKVTDDRLETAYKNVKRIL